MVFDLHQCSVAGVLKIFMGLMASIESCEDWRACTLLQELPLLPLLSTGQPT